MAETTRVPALVLCVVGALAVVGSAVWRRSPSPAPRPAPARSRRPARRDLPMGTSTARASMPRTPRTRLPDGYAPGARRAEPQPMPRFRVGSRAGSPDGPPTVVQRTGADATRVEQAATDRPQPDATRLGADVDPRWVEGARWVDGVGWVHDGPGPIPAEARWVPGVGYVVEER